jgi:hypothetical protein
MHDIVSQKCLRDEGRRKRDDVRWKMDDGRGKTF